MPSNYYEVLQTEPDASTEDIRSAFRRLVLQHHPDLNSGQTTAAESTILLYEAYDTLSNPERRKTYDASLKAARSASTQTVHQKSVRPPSPRLREPEPVICLRCGYCDDTLRYSDFQMVYGQIWRTRKVDVQSGVYCSLCRFLLGTKWLLLCSIFGWWSIPGAFWTLGALPKNSVGGLSARHVQQPVLLSLARRLMWIHQFGDAARVLRYLKRSDPGNKEIAKMISEVSRRTVEGLPRRKPGAIVRRVPLPAVSLPATIVPALVLCQYATTALVLRPHTKPENGLAPYIPRAAEDPSRMTDAPAATAVQETAAPGQPFPDVSYAGSVMYPRIDVPEETSKLPEEAATPNNAPPHSWSRTYGFTKPDDAKPLYDGGYSSSTSAWTGGYNKPTTNMSPGPSNGWVSPYPGLPGGAKSGLSISPDTATEYYSSLMSPKELPAVPAAPWTNPLAP